MISVILFYLRDFNKVILLIFWSSFVNIFRIRFRSIVCEIYTVISILYTLQGFLFFSFSVYISMKWANKLLKTTDTDSHIHYFLPHLFNTNSKDDHSHVSFSYSSNWIFEISLSFRIFLLNTKMIKSIKLTLLLILYSTCFPRV
jgi:hypothetical protein